MAETPSTQPSRGSETSAPEVPEATEIPRFSPEEEAALLKESNSQKLQANALFGSSRFTEAIQEYDKALSSCPNYLEYEIAVLRSNISACHLKLEDWKEAVTAATKALDALERLDPRPPKNKNNSEGESTKDGKERQKQKKKSKLDPNTSGVVEELSDDDEDDGQGTAETPPAKESSTSTNAKTSEPTALERSGKTHDDVDRIRAKALMRRARGRSEEGGWGNLAGAEEDYKELASMPSLPTADKKIVRQALGTLPARIEEAKSKEMGEMFSKLKQLGNGILKPFGLSTDNFKMVKDEATGGYNMQFEQNR
ncbi:putative tetratricopeptide repeat protein 1 [Xylona heveae TC161]|uniref:Putative tetratricopeptide repeat protein 1 n=1 Tax=Xylona heveae (strain CBS 132557 / TC161) TaxID=1328760 RepID=A0A164ZNN2_XYLHT|nr:putative tetratricopeptide repeat protein 1 [Xylona heveae TC161]KZF19317.1 putative tetratricopeptide repeat protein 1 [Xylona heveae TC161]